MKEKLRALAKTLDIPALGVASAEPLSEAEKVLSDWCAHGHHAAMAWYPPTVAQRTHPQALLPHACSVIMIAWPMGEKERPNATLASGILPEGCIARYAAGRDYHETLREKLTLLAEPLRAAGAENFIFTDAQPILERAYAQKSGLGFIGKNNCLIHPRLGSWISLGGILTTQELEPDAPIKNECGDCQRCLETCPGAALIRPNCLDARKCLSYWTVENRGTWPREIRDRMGNRLFGCDACQEACPYNQSVAANAPVIPLQQILDIASNREFENQFRGTAFLRTGRKGWLRNALAVAAYLNRQDLRPAIEALANNSKESEMVCDMARWALEKMSGPNPSDKKKTEA
jgi:epoxyqueuosine reductase